MHLRASFTYLGAYWAILEASWRRLGAPKSTALGCTRLHAAGRGRGGGDAGATPRKDSERIIRIIRKEYHKEVR